MNNQFDGFTNSLAQSVTRRAALKKFGVGLAGIVLVAFGLKQKSYAGGCGKLGAPCKVHFECCSGYCEGLFLGSRRGRCASLS